MPWPCRISLWNNLRVDWCRFPAAMLANVFATGWMVDLRLWAWLVAESLSQLLPLQPDEQLGTADDQLLADSLWAHSTMNHSDSFASKGAAALSKFWPGADRCRRLPWWHGPYRPIGSRQRERRPLGPLGHAFGCGYVKVADSRPVNYGTPCMRLKYTGQYHKTKFWNLFGLSSRF